MRTTPDLATDCILIRPWPDPVIDRLGHDPRSPYVEQFWLGVLGPSTTWLMRRLAGRIFEVGMLMYGKEPTIREMARWAFARTAKE